MSRTLPPNGKGVPPRLAACLKTSGQHRSPLPAMRTQRTFLNANKRATSRRGPCLSAWMAPPPLPIQTGPEPHHTPPHPPPRRQSNVNGIPMFGGDEVKSVSNQFHEANPLSGACEASREADRGGARRGNGGAGTERGWCRLSLHPSTPSLLPREKRPCTVGPSNACRKLEGSAAVWQGAGLFCPALNAS